MTQKEKLIAYKSKMSEQMIKVDSAINKIKLQAASTENPSMLYWNTLNRELKNLYMQMEAGMLKYTGYAIPVEYKLKVQQEIRHIRKLKSVQNRIKGISINLDTPFHRNTINALVDDTAAIIRGSVKAGNEMVSSLLRQTQQQVIRETKINQAIAKGLYEKGTVRQVKNRILEELQKKLKEPYTIRAGSKRFTAKYYSELVARTKIRDAQSQATLNTAVEFGTDLVQVSSHNTTTAICLPFEGKIFSISGKDKDFPPLPDEPPFHPNCLHSITVIFREVLEARGIRQYIDFAQGRTEIHPTRQSHIPISRRKIA